MEEPAKYLLFHGIIILLFALLAGFPYARSVRPDIPIRGELPHR